MNEHLQELKAGGRPKRKWEIELEEKDKEIEKLREENLLLKASEPMSKLQEDYGYKEEVERLHYIIKEVRDYPDNAKDNYIINKHQYVNFDNIREILDKEKSNE